MGLVRAGEIHGAAPAAADDGDHAMIIVSVLLVSAQTGEVSELARMRICNDGTSESLTTGDYVGETFIGRSQEALNRFTVSKRGEVKGYPRQRLHVFNLVARMLSSMGYTK